MLFQTSSMVSANTEAVSNLPPPAPSLPTKSVSQNWQIGIAGYGYYQLTADSGSGDRVGAFKSRIAAIGPQIGYLFNIGTKQAYINVRAYKEFWAQNRVEGYATIATISIPLGK